VSWLYKNILIDGKIKSDDMGIKWRRMQINLETPKIKQQKIRKKQVRQAEKENKFIPTPQWAAVFVFGFPRFCFSRIFGCVRACRSNFSRTPKCPVFPVLEQTALIKTFKY